MRFPPGIQHICRGYKSQKCFAWWAQGQLSELPSFWDQPAFLIQSRFASTFGKALRAVAAEHAVVQAHTLRSRLAGLDGLSVSGLKKLLTAPAVGNHQMVNQCRESFTSCLDALLVDNLGGDGPAARLVQNFAHIATLAISTDFLPSRWQKQLAPLQL